MKRKSTLQTLAIVLALLLGLMAQSIWAATIPLLSLPSYPVRADFYPGTGNAYFNVLFLYMEERFDVDADTAYSGYCIDPNSTGVGDTDRYLYSSYDPRLPRAVRTYRGRTIPWDKVNYLLNHKLGTALNVQAALELLITGESNEWTDNLNDLALQMVDEANAQGSGFVPGSGQVIAVILYVDGISEQEDRAQDTIIELPVSELGALGDYVWEDRNANGIQDEGEPGINGVTVRLYDCSGQRLASTTTAADAYGNAGYYLFEGLMEGCYRVEFVAPSGYSLSPANQGTDDAADSDADPATGRTGDIYLPAGVTDRTWDAGLHQPLCGLVLDQTCQVPMPPTSFKCSDAKPIDELSMVWNGAETVRVVAWYGSVGSRVVDTVENVAPGDVVTLDGFAGSPNDVYWEIYAAGLKIGESVFHLSCSDENMNGPEDCGLPQGDAKDKSGYLNDWLLEGMAGANGQALVCNPQPQPGSDTCEAVLPAAPSCASLGKPFSLAFLYTGESCAASDNDQGDKDKCSDAATPDPSRAVQIVYTGKDPDKFVVSPTSVMPGQEVTIEAAGRDEFHADTQLEIRQDGRLIQSLSIHTSCSQPLDAGDQFGSLELVAFNGQDARGVEVIYSYSVTNNGSPLVDVKVVDDLLGQIAGPFGLATGESQIFYAVGYLRETTTVEATATGMMANGAFCQASDTTTVQIVEPCAECKGGVTELTLRYQGLRSVNVVVYEGRDPKSVKALYRGTVSPGDEFTFEGIRSDKTMSSEISIWVNGQLAEKIHTSCSQPIGPGMIVGAFEIVSGRSKDNGLMCPLNVCAPQPASAIEFHDREIKWKMTNAGDVGLTIQRLYVSWPGANGELDEIKRDGDTIHKGNFAPPSAVIDSGWEGDASKRTIKAGEENALKLKFKNNAVQGEYRIVVEFGGGCSVEIEHGAGPEPTPLVCTDKIKAVSLRYTGPGIAGPATVEFDPDRGATMVYHLASLISGQVLSDASQNGWTIDATASGETDLGAKMAIRINGVQTVIHTSCSTPFVAGAPAPLDSPKGAPSPLWFVESFVQK